MRIKIIAQWLIQTERIKPMSNNAHPASNEKKGNPLTVQDFCHFTYVALIKSELVNFLYSLKYEDDFSIENATDCTSDILEKVIDFEDYFTDQFIANCDIKRQNRPNA
ncbi:hypothetical protein D3C75_179040 [compost metagenome]